MRILSCSLLAVALLFSGAAFGDAGVKETRKLLADHQTVAKFKGVAFRKCMGLTAMCPDNCGHSGDFASFDIVGYIKYEKADQYGDEKSDSFIVQIQDNKKNAKVSKEIADTVKGLKADDYVVLTWHHDYVTRTEGGGSSSFPERPIVKLEKISKEKGEELLKGK